MCSKHIRSQSRVKRMEEYSCPTCGHLVEDVTRVDTLTARQTVKYLAGNLGVYACLSCGWIGDEEEMEESLGRK